MVFRGKRDSSIEAEIFWSTLLVIIYSLFPFLSPVPGARRRLSWMKSGLETTSDPQLPASPQDSGNLTKAVLGATFFALTRYSQIIYLCSRLNIR